jgi:carbamoyltransferase
MLYASKIKIQGLDSITHVDGTCRVQEVNKQNGIFRTLLAEFYNVTGCPILLNTSLNLAGKPLAASPEDALELFYNSDIDCLIIGDKKYTK